MVNLDSKGRIAIPTRYRPEILEINQGQMVCTVDICQPCLLLYPLNQWEIIEHKLSKLSNFNPKSVVWKTCNARLCNRIM